MARLNEILSCDDDSRDELTTFISSIEGDLLVTSNNIDGVIYSTIIVKEDVPELIKYLTRTFINA